ncbi:MAG TPA: PTS fructose transporter subunit IIA [Gammaproteobacteria bacterium]|nr:PTS fructose transporter subunit IIA [Gammaproteobacteria bacterium]
MNVGLLIITHNRVGAELLETATTMLGRCPLNARLLAVTPASEPEALQARARALLAEVKGRDGAIVLTDMYGSTPANVAQRLQADHPGVEVITGINLPMLVRLLNYPHLSRAQLVEKALSGGREGVFLCLCGEDRDS